MTIGEGIFYAIMGIAIAACAAVAGTAFIAMILS